MTILEILKLIKGGFDNYYVVFDKIPKMTYERIGQDYVGSALDLNGNIIASQWLKKERYGDAFAGRELELKMKDGSLKTIKNYWFDRGSYPSHGKFMSIGANTLKGLQRCYVYSAYNINVETFRKMKDQYFKFDRVYDYYEVEKWCDLQYEWFDVVVNGKKIPYMMNLHGRTVERETKKRVCSRTDVVKRLYGVRKRYSFFELEHREGERLRKVHANYLQVLKDTLPYTEEEIRKNCDLLSIDEENRLKRKIKTFRENERFDEREREEVLRMLKKDS